ncbi:DUF1249 domain-containing protein [Kangiella sediminilitoris]|uniref:Dehydrogenase n=1 Tax=Kangiella sediminilitoris TaxID=1144748 RepID=A0A1B3B8Z8_9GAMM|nr:DUF1249 domain-containing protein [Kangiella sediminilitoris]AOE49277.1 dehydrogenase [Kangiella sediminilitoris]
MSSRVKRKYIPDLKEFMALCASNYAKLARLTGLVDLEVGQAFTIPIDNQPDLKITLKQISRHTATYALTQTSSQISLKRDYLVRMYHDAKVAEVLSGLNKGMLPPVFPYPNEKMRQPDEKIQLNRFLSEWLNFCLEFGRPHSLSKTQLVFFD